MKRECLLEHPQDHAPCPYSEPEQSSPCPHPISWISILILYFNLYLGISSGLFQSGLPTQTLYAPLLSSTRAKLFAHLILLDFNTQIKFGEPYRT